jgi:hypothetical protein
MKDLTDFIADVEARHFRTVNDTGANLNALMIWNRVREFAGLPELTMDELAAKYPGGGEWKALKVKYRAAHGEACTFPTFALWCEFGDPS